MIVDQNFHRKLKLFVDIRARSGFDSNLQFQIDLETAGLKIADLGPVEKLGEGLYVWNTPGGKLVEEHGVCRLEDA